MKFFILVIAVLALNLVAEEEKFIPIKYKSCKSVFEVISVESTICPMDEDSRCIFTQNDSPKIRISFKPNRGVSALIAKVRARLQSKYVSFPLENEDACKGQNITCPLVPNQTYFYTQSVHIAREYPPVNVMVNWMLNDPSISTANSSTYFNAEGERIRSDVCIVFLAKVLRAGES